MATKNTHTVEMYTTPWCHFCHLTKQFFGEKGVAFTEYNVQTDAAKRQEMVQKTGQMGVPVIVVDGSEVVVGFDKPRLSQLLGIS